MKNLGKKAIDTFHDGKDMVVDFIDTMEEERKKQLKQVSLGAIIGGALSLGVVKSCSEDSNSNIIQQPQVLEITGEKVGDYVCGILDGQIQSRNTASQHNNPLHINFHPSENEAVVKNNKLIHSKYRLSNKLENNNMEIYFTTSKTFLDDDDKNDIDRFITQLLHQRKNPSIVLEGFADSRGKSYKNQELSRLRAQEVARYLKNEHGIQNVDISYYGDTKSKIHNSNATTEDKLKYRKDRKVNIISDGNIISRGLSLFPADVYLVDASTSMNEVVGNGNQTKWDMINNHDFQNKAVYSFTTENINGCTGGISNQIVEGRTPLYESIYDLVKEKDFSSITVLSDGEDNESSVSLQDTIRVAKQKSVSVNVIGIGDYHKGNLQKLAEQTGGKYYFQD